MRTALCLLAVGAAVLGSAPSANAAPGAGPGVCPTNGIVPFTSTFSNGSVKLGNSATVSGSTGRACGVQLVGADGGLMSKIKPANIAFAPVQTKVAGILPFPTTFKATSALQGPAGFGTRGGLAAVLAGNVTATAEILGQKCDIPLKLRLTTGKSGALLGTEFTADSSGQMQVGKLVDGRFTVPEITPSPTCNVVVAALTNKLLGLPLAAGQSTITYDATLAFGSFG